jgi:4-amino-4-deoxy-L-arabinose transferase-like glycosyltransferase
MDILRQKAAKILKRTLIIFKKEKHLLLAIFILGLLLRLTGLLNITLAGDNLLHWRIAGEIVTKGASPLLGPRASITGDFNLGPFYYYLLAIPYWLGRGDFRAAIVFFAFLNSLSIPLLYLVAKRWFSKWQSLKISFLFVCSAYFIQIQSFPWNPYALPFFIILCLYFINKIHQRKFLNFIFLSLSYAICLQLHATAIFLLPIFIYLLPLKKIPLRHYLLGLSLFLSFNLPWIWVNLVSNFSQTRAAFFIFNQDNTKHCSFISWLANHGNGERCFWYFRNTLFAFRFLTVSLFDINNVFLALLGMATIALYFIKTKLRENRYLFVWFFVPMLLFLFYSNSIYLHYFLILTPLPFLLFVALLNKIENKGKQWAFIANALYILVIAINLLQYVWSLQFVRG